MSRPATRLHGSAPEETAGAQELGAQSAQTPDPVLSAAFGHTLTNAQEISYLCSHREGFGLGCVLLHFMRTGRSALPLECLDLSDFSLGARKLRFLLSSLPAGPAPLQTLKCGPGVCTPSSLPVLASFLQRLKSGGEGGGATGGMSCSLKTLIASSNSFRSVSMDSLSAAVTARWLPSLLSLDLSDNPLGPLGVRALASGLAAPLQSLNLARTGAKAKGVEALAKALKEKRVTSLRSLDLEGNDMGAGGFKHLVAGVCEVGAVPLLRVLLLKNNSLSLTPISPGSVQQKRDYAPLSALLSTTQLTELEELDLSENSLFDEQLGVEGAPERVSAAAVVAAGRFPKLRVLKLSDTEMSSEETAAFANALGEGGAPLLEDLDLSGENEGRVGEGEEETGMQALANALHNGRLSQLCRIRLGERLDLSFQHMKAIFEATAHDKTPALRTIEVCISSYVSEMLCDEAVEALARAVGEGKVGKIETLHLDVWAGYLRSATMSSLGRALGSGGASSLRKLKLRCDCPVDDESDGGVVGLAEGLGGGGMPLVEDLDLEVSCASGEGGSALGEVLSTGKAPSLRRVRLTVYDSELLSALCEGLCVGNSPPALMRMELDLQTEYSAGHETAISRLAEGIRSGHISYLQKLSADCRFTSAATAEALGGALTHSGAAMKFLEELFLKFCYGPPAERIQAFFGGILRGSHCLPSLKKLETTPHVHRCSPQLSRLVTAGKVPCLTEMNLNLKDTGLQEMQLLANTLGSPHAASLRRVEVQFCDPDDPPDLDASAKVATFCVALASTYLSKLQVLQVEGIQDRSGSRALCAGLRSGKLSSLRELSLRQISLQSEEAALSEALDAQKLPGLRMLSIYESSLSNDGLKALLNAWTNRTPPPLDLLDLQRNSLSDGGAESLADFLASRRIPSLSKVNLRRNRISHVATVWLRKGFPEMVDS